MIDDHTARVARAYDRWAATYDGSPNPTRDLDAQVLRQHGPEVRGHVVLELGSGTGKNTVWLAARAGHVIACDLSHTMQQVARERLAAAGVPPDRVSFVSHDLTERPWPLADESVEMVFANLVLEHVPDLAALCTEVVRVLRPGGTFWVSELHPERQRLGGQAHFVDEATSETVRVPACRHSVSDYVNAAVAAGLRVRRLGEWREEGADPSAPARLFTMRAKK
jgi:ubiquinone/menaquinone biosynthesis C-methylase UbiE